MSWLLPSERHLGGPVGGAAAGMLANVLGCDPTPQKIEKALTAGHTGAAR